MKGRRPSPGFDRVAAVYPLLEKLVYGRSLEPGRYCFLPELNGCTDILLLGEGNGRFLRRLLEHNPLAKVTVVEVSPRMIACARNALSEPQLPRVRWCEASALEVPLPRAAFDAVISHYLFDLFPPAEQRQILQNTVPALRDGGLWQDTELSATGNSAITSLCNRARLALSYRFLGLMCHFPARALHCPAPLFQASGLVLQKATQPTGETVARLWQKPSPSACGNSVWRQVSVIK